MNAKNSLLTLTVVTALLAGCSVGPTYHRPVVDLPDAHRGAAASAEAPVPDSAATAPSLADMPWWSLFDDPVLEDLIAEALERSHDVRLAAWRVEEARARAGIARAERFPTIDTAAGWSRGRESRTLVPGAETGELYDVHLGISWEVDLWGRLRHLDEAARSRFLATEEARRGVLLSLTSDVATSYFRLLALDRQLEIARRTAGTFAETRQLFDHRLAAGLASGLETASAEAAQRSTTARIPDLERQVAAEENRLAVLLGRPPGDVARGASLEDQALPVAIPPGLPSDLLERRPDLRQAERQLIAANAEVGVAVAELFPTLRLTGVFGGVAPELADVVSDGKTWSVGGGLLAPLIQGKRLANQHRAAVARWNQAQVRYEAAVRRALAEVSTALIAHQRLAEAEREQELAVAASRDAVRAASSRYVSGLADYFEVLQAQQQLFPAEQTLADIRFARLATLVEVYRSLGGGWHLDAEEWTGGDRVAALR